jgi:hypothetical protein
MIMLVNQCVIYMEMTKEAIVDHIDYCLQNKNRGKPTPEDVDSIFPFAQDEKNGNKVMEMLLMHLPFEDDMLDQRESYRELVLMPNFFVARALANAK